MTRYSPGVIRLKFDVVRDALEQLRRHTPTPATQAPRMTERNSSSTCSNPGGSRACRLPPSCVPAGLPADHRGGTLSETIIRERR